MQNTTPADRIAHAKQAAGWGFKVIELYGTLNGCCHCGNGFKCKTPGKHPADREWQRGPGLTTADIDHRWSQRPRANVGVATGQASAFFVLDIDPDHGGMDSARQLIAEHPGGLGTTRIHQTGSGGFHYLYRMPSDFDVTNARGKLKSLPGIDIRGTGGQVVWPGSQTDKGPYLVRVNAPIAPAPPWLLDMLRPQSVEQRTVDRPEPMATYTPYVAAARGGVQRDLTDRPAVDTAGWNNSTHAFACKLIEVANMGDPSYTLEQAHADIHDWAPHDDGFGYPEIEKCWQSALKRVGGKARVATGPAPRGVDPF